MSEDGRTVRLFAGDVKDASLILRKAPDGWVLDEFAPYLGWVEHRGTGARLAWDGTGRQDQTERFLLFFERTVALKPPVLLMLDPGRLEPRPVAGISTSAFCINDSVFYSSRIIDIPGIDPLLLETDIGCAAFDGSALTDFPELSAERIGEHARISKVGPLVLIQSVKGVFQLTKELGAERVETFPDKQSPSSVSITWLEVMLWR